jgi:hypothetical protein
VDRQLGKGVVGEGQDPVRGRALAVGFVAAIAIGAAACGGGEGAGGDSAAPARDVRITLERTPCFGRCPIYLVEIDGTGRVVFDGRGFVKETGRHESTVASESVQALARELEAGGYFGFRDHYPPDKTDHAGVITSVTIDGRTHRIEHNLGSDAAPSVLADLERRIDEVAGTARWIGEPQQGGGRDSGGR